MAQERGARRTRLVLVSALSSIPRISLTGSGLYLEKKKKSGDSRRTSGAYEAPRGWEEEGLCPLPDTQNLTPSQRQAGDHGRDRHPPLTPCLLPGAPARAPCCLGTPVPSDPATAAHAARPRSCRLPAPRRQEGDTWSQHSWWQGVPLPG